MLKRFYLFISSCLLVLTCGSSHAEKLILLSAGADPWPPYIDESLPKGGVSVQIADAALRTQGYTVKNRILPWARALEETKQARVDLIVDAWWSQERSEQFLYSRPYINGPIKFIKQKGDEFQFVNLSSLDGKSLVLVRDYAYGDELLSAENYTQYMAHDFMQGMQMLALGRVDFALENELVARTRLLQEAPQILPMIEFSEKPLADNYVYVIAGYKHPKHQEMIGAFNRGLDVILQNGTYQKILKDNGLTVPDMFKHLKP